MNAAEAKKLVIVSTATTAVLSSIGAARKTGSVPARRMVVGSFVVGVGLAVVAEFAPPIAGGMAALMLVTSVFVLGGDAMKGITAITAPTSITPTPN